MCAAPAAGLTLDSLKQAPSAAVGASGAAPKDVRVVREWAGPVCRSRLVNDGPAPVRVREAILFDVPHDHPAETRLDGEGFTMLSQTAGTCRKLHRVNRHSCLLGHAGTQAGFSEAIGPSRAGSKGM